MQSTIESLSRRTRRYWLIDGLAEITLGGMFLYLCEHQDMGEEMQ